VAAKRDFTDRFLRALKPAAPGKRYITYDAQIPGFGIRVTDRCAEEIKGSFVLVTRFPGSANPAPRRIGDYPPMSLAKAWEIARAWREDIRQGVDPKIKETDRRRQQERHRANTFAAVFATFTDDHLISLRTGRDVANAIENHVFPRWGERPISAIKRADVNELVRALRKDAPIMANRVLAYLKKFFSWVVDQEMIDASPAASVKWPTKESKRDRTLSEQEIAAIWQACGGLGAFGRAFKFMLATGARRSEVGAMTWREVSLAERLWTLPRERTKADRGHEIPLSDIALAILAECPELGEFVFTTNGARPISGWSKAKTALDKALAQERAAVAGWRLHDLRRSCATHLARCGVDRIVIAKVLNHAENEVTAIYDRHRYEREKRAALDRWGERLTEIVAGAGKREADVVILPKARAR
jgi:integrase